MMFPYENLIPTNRVVVVIILKFTRVDNTVTEFIINCSKLHKHISRL